MNAKAKADNTYMKVLNRTLEKGSVVLSLAVALPLRDGGRSDFKGLFGSVRKVLRLRVDMALSSRWVAADFKEQHRDVVM